MKLLKGGIYQGEVKKEGFFTVEKIAHGKGIIQRQDGSCVEGNFKAGKMTGKGRHISADGIIYIGYFRNGKFEGTGIRVWPSG